MSIALDKLPESFEQDRQQLTRWLRGDKEAIRFCEMFFYVCHLWDDLIDKDKERDAEDIHTAFWMLMVEIPRNRFYLSHLNELSPVIAVAINEWHIANKFEHDGHPHELDIAYTLRCSILSVIEHCIWLIGGYAWMQEVAHEVRIYGQRETRNGYLEDFKKCQTSEQQ